MIEHLEAVLKPARFSGVVVSLTKRLISNVRKSSTLRVETPLLSSPAMNSAAEGMFDGTAGNHLPAYDLSPPYGEERHRPFTPSPPPTEYSIFPRDIVFYREEYISLIIGHQYEANKPHPPPLFYVSIHMDNRWTNRNAVPQIRLHYGPDNTYPVIGAVRFRATTTSDIIIWHRSNTNSFSNVSNDDVSEAQIELTKTGALTTALHSFYHELPVVNGTQVRKKFKWRFSGHPEVKKMATENLPGENISQQNRGLKLVRVSTGAMVAAWAGGVHNRLYNPRRIAGKMRFLEEDASEEMRLLAVMSILSIVERGRRNAVANAQAPFLCMIQ